MFKKAHVEKYHRDRRHHLLSSRTATGLAFEMESRKACSTLECRYQSVEITNNAEYIVEYNFSLQPAAGVEAKAPTNSALAILVDLKPVQMVPAVKMPSGSYKLVPGQTKKAE